MPFLTSCSSIKRGLGCLDHPTTVSHVCSLGGVTGEFRGRYWGISGVLLGNLGDVTGEFRGRYCGIPGGFAACSPGVFVAVVPVGDPLSCLPGQVKRR